jgi:uncharacterized membrane protein
MPSRLRPQTQTPDIDTLIHGSMLKSMSRKEFAIFFLSWMALVVVANWLQRGWHRNAWETIATNVLMLVAVWAAVLAYRRISRRGRVPPG